MDGIDGVADDDVASGFFDDGQRLENRDAAADQRTESSREAGDSDLADDRANDGHLKFELIPDMPAELGANEQIEHHQESNYDTQCHQDVIFNHAADTQDQAGKGGQRTAFHHAFKHGFERGNDLHHQDDQNSGRHHQDGARIK